MIIRKQGKVVRVVFQQQRSYHEVSFAQHGDPRHVLQYHRQHQQHQQAAINNNSNHQKPLFTIEMKYAAWNPADINQIQGKYPSLASPEWRKSSCTQRTVAGAEGIGIVVDISDDSIDNCHGDIKIGDTVITMGGIGTFRSHVSLPPECVLPVFANKKHEIVPRDPIFFQLTGTSYNLLHQHPSLNNNNNCTGGVILQNAGNSAVGTVLSQMAHCIHPSIPVVSMVRQRTANADMDALEDYLTFTCHATRVIVQEEYMHFNDRAKVKQLRDQYPFQLALNAVGGVASNLLLQCLQPTGRHVTYGGMSRQPVTASTGDFVFRNLQLTGYWHSQWMWQQQQQQRVAFVQQLVGDFYDKIQLPPVQVFALRDWSEALQWDAEQQQQRQKIRSKIVFDLSLE